jgi:hypothetical protein
MSTESSDYPGLLRWYPKEWRERYGEELGALMEDSLNGQPPTPRLRLSIAWSGLRERAHQAGVIGEGTPAPNRLAAGALLVLSAWTAFMVAGANFAKFSEGFSPAVPAGSRALATRSFDVVQFLAVAGGLLVIAGAAVALPAFIRFVRDGGWSAIRRHVYRAVAATVIASGITVGVITKAHTLPYAQRNGADGAYTGLFLVAAGLMVVALALWTVVAVASARRLTWTDAVLRVEATLATGLAMAMVVMTAAVATWWGTVASAASWYLQGVQPGLATSAFTPRLTGSMIVMLVASAFAAYGVARMARSWKALRVS